MVGPHRDSLPHLSNITAKDCTVMKQSKELSGDLLPEHKKFNTYPCIKYLTFCDVFSGRVFFLSCLSTCDNILWISFFEKCRVLANIRYEDLQCQGHKVKSSDLFETVHITKTYLYNFDPLKPHFYIVELRFTGVFIIFFLFLLKNIDCELEPPRRF